MTASTWDHVLDGFEAELARAEALLAEGAPEGAELAAPAWEPPHGLGTLPVQLADRAATVLHRQRAVLEALRSAAAHTRAELELVEAHRTRPSRPTPTFVDRAL